ncbi:GLUG motif-containing protein [Anaerotignum neopropionicum]|uniref:GLUG motif-containing protein n=1 Tax=Anaerotignum neopropionicum TaxID=36847 RepID=UPI000825C45B|nr:GLUG motif-containing protein [Anaerotignum neopropionicum]
MNQHKPSRRLLAMALSVVMVLGMLPITAAAEDLPAGTSGEITAFEKLVDGTVIQTVALGTPFEDLDLPETLTATVRLETDASQQAQDSGNSVQQEQVATGAAVTLAQEEPADEGTQQEQAPEEEISPEHEDTSASDQEAVDLVQEESDTGYTEMTVQVPVTWTASPDYDGNAAGVYVYTAEISGFTVSSELPVITITVGQATATGTITAFDELKDEIRWQNTTKAELPSELTGTVEGENVQISVTWEADHDYDSDSPTTGLYVFTAKPGEDYTLAEDVESPRITVYIPAVKRMMRLMAGSGTSTSPLEITTAAQLAEIAVLVNDGRLESFLLGDSTATVSLKLMNDLDLSAYGENFNSGKGWVPIGTLNNSFKGSFDGNDNEITGLYINRTEDYTGLFGRINGGTVQNLGLVEVSITGGNNVGNVAGRVDGSVTNCNASGSVSGNENVGGVVGTIASVGSVTNCYAMGAVSGTNVVGGVAGDVYGSVTNCYATGGISGNTHVGGVAGTVDGSVTNCYATGSVSGTTAVGGVTGRVDGSVTSCYATGGVSGNGTVGGVAGYVDGSMTNCYATGVVTGIDGYVGGVAGAITGNVTSCAALNPSVIGNSDVGRVVGYIVDEGTLSDNAAFSGMAVTVNGAPQTISDDAADNKSGADISATEIQADGSIGNRFTTTNDWTVENGKLPILQNVGGTQSADLPPHLANDTSAPYFLGEGTETVPYQISTAAQLAKLAELVDAYDTNYNDKYYKLTADLDLSAYGEGWNSGKGWIPIGTTDYRTFKGTFDGDNHKISGLYINRGTENYIGLFGYIKGGTVQNIGIEEVSLVGQDYVGGMAGKIDTGSVTNCHVTGAVSNTGGYVGGVAGYVGGVEGSADGSVKNCYATCTVSGRIAGGVVAGANINASVTSCYATGAVSGSVRVGGVAGMVADASVTNCYATGAVTGTGAYVGGVVGLLGGSMTNCYATGAVSGATVGGLVGVIGSGGDSSSVTSCAALNPGVNGTGSVMRVLGQNAGEVTLSNTGAFSGMTVMLNGAPQTISDGAADNINGEDISAAEIQADGTIGSRFTDTSIWTVEDGKLPILKNVGGTQNAALPPHLAGGSSTYFLGAGTDSDPYQISTAAQLAKLAELVNADDTNYNDKYYKLTADLDLSAYGKNWNSGKGWIPMGRDVANCFKGSFDGNGKKITGLYIKRTANYTGLFGYIRDGTVQNLGLEEVSIVGIGSEVGGVAGYVSGSVTNCYVTGAVSGTGTNVGGVVGYVSGSITNCYVTGSISGKYNIGGVAGLVYGSVTNCYATGTVSGTDYVGGVAGQLQCNSSVINCYATGAVSGSNYVGGVAGYVDGSATSCAALNPSVNGSSDVGRVVGYIPYGDPLSDNVAFSSMTVKVNGVPQSISDGAADNINGEDISAAQIKADGTIDGCFADTSIWTAVNGKLPILQNVGGTQSGDGGLYLITRDIAGVLVTLNENTYTYTGSPILPTLEVIFGKQALEKDVDYTVSATSVDGTDTSAGTNAGTVTLTLTGIGSFTGTKTGVTYNIEKRNDRSAPALNYTVSESDFPKTVTITEVEGAEYQFNNGGYSQTRIFTSNSVEEVMLSIRLKETEAYNASPETSVTVNTANQDQSAPSAFTLTYESVDDASYTVTIPATAGAEYSFNGTTWSGENTKTGCQSGDSITGYKRMAAKPGYNASSNIIDSVTLPLFQVKTPAASPNGGTFKGSQSVILSCQTAGVQIYYTTDGSTPTTTSTLYSAPFPLTSTTTVKAIAVKTGMIDSGVLSVTFTKQSGGSNGGGSSSGGSSTSTTTPEKKPNQPVTATAGANGTASASIPDKTVTDAIAKAQADAKAQGKTANEFSVELNIIMPKGASSLTAVLTRSSLDSLVSAGVSSLEINGSLVKVSFDKTALMEIQKQSSGNVNIAIAPKTNLSDAAKILIGTRPVYDITVGYGSGKSVANFGGGVATVSIPYTLGKNEVVDGLYAVYVDEKGNATPIAGSAYDANSGSVIFTTTHFSQYGIGYTAPTENFTDISSHWGKESIEYVVGRGLVSGMTETTFAPDSPMTRGMLVTAFGKLAGADAKAYTTNRFTDVNEESAYRPYVEWAYSKGIIRGIGDNQFAPDRAITREEIAVIFANYGKATGYTFPVTGEATTYADASSIGSAYKDAVKAMQQAGIMMGGGDNKFNPKGNATRAEVSSMLSRYIKLTINADTAQGAE